jgi:hypothetical protein
MITMFPKSSFVMMIVAGSMLVIAMALDYYGGKDVNKFYLGFGLLMLIVGVAALLFKKK